MRTDEAYQYASQVLALGTQHPDGAADLGSAHRRDSHWYIGYERCECDGVEDEWGGSLDPLKEIQGHDLFIQLPLIHICAYT